MVLKVIQKQMTAVINRIQQGWINGVFFALLFALLGLAIPSTYFKYFDNRDYYRVLSATPLQKEVKVCSNLEVALNREADLTIQGKSVIEYVLVRTDTLQSEVARLTRDLSIDKGSAVIVAVFPIGCDIPTGSYYLRGTVSYNVRGGDHITEWHTDAFTVTAK